MGRSFRETWERTREIAGMLFSRAFVVRSRIGVRALSVPVIVGILLIIFAAKIVLIGLIIALVAGYRISIERR